MDDTKCNCIFAWSMTFFFLCKHLVTFWVLCCDLIFTVLHKKGSLFYRLQGGCKIQLWKYPINPLSIQKLCHNSYITISNSLFSPKCHDCMVTTHVLYLVLPKLKSWPWDRLSWLKFIMIFLRPSKQMSKEYSMLGHDPFLQCPLQLFIILSFDAIMFRSTDNIVKECIHK
jgi:hypothetical protein